MGREAVCTCDWAGHVTEVKALLEPGELILRGGIRRRVPFPEMKHVHATDSDLCFTLADEKIQLVLGASTAAKWAAIITTPPPALSRKLGITGDSVVCVLGQVNCEELQAALAAAARTSSANPNLIVACVDTPASLQAALKLADSDLRKGVPIWMIYAKGPGHALNETAIRSQLRAHGLMDTKVASVSSAFTALRFSQ